MAANSRIHPTHVKQAQQLGVVLEPAEIGVKAIWSEHNRSITGPDAKEALARIKAVQAEYRKNEVHPQFAEAVAKLNPEPLFAEDPPPTVNNIPTNGRAAHRAGFHINDNPFPAEGDEWARWDEQWEASAEDAMGEPAPTEEEEKKPASVVKTKYRAIYAELGHPTTCGDELANKLDNLVKNAKGTNMEYFDLIMEANGVDMSKYSRTTPGWQGRYRMTGRNMLAKRVHANGGIFVMPAAWGVEDMRMSADWMSSQRFQK